MKVVYREVIWPGVSHERNANAASIQVIVTCRTQVNILLDNTKVSS